MPRLYGRHAKVLWTPGSGGESFRRSSTVILDALAFRESWQVHETNIRPLGEPDDAFASMGRTGSFLLRLDVRTSSTLQLPSHVPATVRIYDTKHVAAYRQGSALITRADWDAQAEQPGQVQRQWYNAKWTGEMTTGTESAPTLVSAVWVNNVSLTLTFSRSIARGSAALANGVTIITAAGVKYIMNSEPSIAGAVATFAAPDATIGSFTPVSTCDVVAGFFKSSEYPDDSAMVQAVINDAVLT